MEKNCEFNQEICILHMHMFMYIYVNVYLV